MSIWSLFGTKEVKEVEEPPPPPPPDSCCKKFSSFLKVYWRALFAIIWPLIWLPLLICKFYQNDYRVLYCVCLMAGYWVTECLPLPITSCIPILYMPIMGITGTTEICMTYFNGTNIMFLTSVMIALAVKHCNLHMRIALLVLLIVGCSPRRLHFGVMTITHLLSWWMLNTACTAMMCPILLGVLEELEKQGMDPVYLLSEDGEVVEDVTKRRPSHTTIAFFLAAAYGSTTGGCATLVGTDTNLVLRGHIEEFEETHNLKKEGVNFAKFMGFNGPTMFIINCLSWVVIQFMWLGLWRPNSKDYQTVQKGIELKDLAKQVLKEKFDDLGKMSWHESWILFLYILVILLWFFRDPGFMPGWKVISKTEVGDGVACIFILLLMFLIPKDPACFKIFSKNPEDRPIEMSEGLLNWKVLHEQTPWGLMFLLGGGFALAKASDNSKMSDLVGGWLQPMKVLPEWLIMMICATAASFMTELTANVSICNILVPIVLNLASKIKAKHLFLSMPTAIACSFAFCLPSGTPPNALVVGFVNMPISAMAKTGIIISIIALIVYFGAIESYGRLFYDI